MSNIMRFRSNLTVDDFYGTHGVAIRYEVSRHPIERLVDIGKNLWLHLVNLMTGASSVVLVLCCIVGTTLVPHFPSLMALTVLLMMALRAVLALRPANIFTRDNALLGLFAGVSFEISTFAEVASSLPHADRSVDVYLETAATNLFVGILLPCAVVFMTACIATFTSRALMFRLWRYMRNRPVPTIPVNYHETLKSRSIHS